MSAVHTILRITLIASLACVSQCASGADWPQWRGPFHNGSSDETGLPGKWSLKKNLRWAAEMPGRGGSSPIVMGDRIFLTSTDRTNKNLYALCVERSSGKILWQKTIADCGRKAPYNRDASPSAVADAERVYFLFGTGDFLATDHDGQVLWRRSLEKDFGPLTLTFLYSASPLLYRDRLYLSVLRETATSNPYLHKVAADSLDSFVLCVDPATGDDIWKVDRPSDAEGVENRESYATPTVCEFDGKVEIAIIGADYLTGHDWKTGREKWRMKYEEINEYRQRVVPTPLFAEGLLICSKPRCGPLFAVHPGGEGTIPYSAAAWTYEGETPDSPSLLHYGKRLYFLHDSHKVMTCLDAKTGAKIWEEPLPGVGLYHASPTASDGKIYCITRGGDITVLAAGDEFEVISRVSVDGMPCPAGIVIAHGALFVRTEEKLYCIAKQP